MIVPPHASARKCPVGGFKREEVPAHQRAVLGLNCGSIDRMYPVSSRRLDTAGEVLLVQRRRAGRDPARRQGRGRWARRRALLERQRAGHRRRPGSSTDSGCRRRRSGWGSRRRGGSSRRARCPGGSCCASTSRARRSRRCRRAAPSAAARPRGGGRPGRSARRPRDGGGDVVEGDDAHVGRERNSVRDATRGHARCRASGPRGIRGRPPGASATLERVSSVHALLGSSRSGSRGSPRAAPDAVALESGGSTPPLSLIDPKP